MALELERSPDYQTSRQEEEQEPRQDQSQLERQIKLTLVAASCFIVIYAGIAWYDGYERNNLELKFVPPPPAAITGSEIFDRDKATTQ